MDTEEGGASVLHREMIEKTNTNHSLDEDTFEVSCDSCSHSKEYTVGFWEELMRLMRDDGWESKKIDGDWEHKCISCVPEEALVPQEEDW